MSDFGNIFKETASIASNQWRKIIRSHLKTATLSKSSFVMGCQCTKLMWLHKYKYAERKVLVETQSKFDRGHIIGDLAQHLFPDGIDASDNINNVRTKYHQTPKQNYAKLLNKYMPNS